MKLSFDYKGIKVTYYLTYKKAKAISIQVTEEGRVNVTAPRGTPVFAVMDKVKVMHLGLSMNCMVKKQKLKRK